MSSYAMLERPEKRAERLAAEQGTVRCALCPWQATGSMLRAMERARAHRAKAHPEAPVESTARWHNEPPRGRQAPAPIAQAEPRREPSFRERAVELLRERGESTAAALAGELGSSPASVSSALGHAVRAGTVESRSRQGAKEKLWRPAGAEPGPDPEPRPSCVGVDEALKATGRPMTINEVAEATGRPRDSVATTLASLVRRGLAERAGRGVYRLAP